MKCFLDHFLHNFGNNSDIEILSHRTCYLVPYAIPRGSLSPPREIEIEFEIRNHTPLGGSPPHRESLPPRGITLRSKPVENGIGIENRKSSSNVKIEFSLIKLRDRRIQT